MYIFGYGSLLNTHSRLLTGQTGDAIPVVVRGLVRHWSLIDDSYQLSPLAIEIGEGQVNGVLLEVDDSSLGEFDIREAGYSRIKINHNKIDVSVKLDSTKPVWVYVTNSIKNPTVHAPIVQSYVDTVLAGCLEISEDFAIHFIETTLGWQHPFENDRTQPKYQRQAGVTDEHRSVIDNLLVKSAAYSL
ncbi:gamma-glutamylcyclotransferase family protein [Vibrio sp. TH_r3]|uniref:gamma-glutamylcyclotransferase family protein n=1 Tax=Vibrio sp. TH_r3 TaxID=3082084 RepID=UPI0029552B80|nr:gamma-glutamylcyclotransferase family protein [Vibrio sp. TH_r3]MDV7103562.1 gamma-glutamylcyclotransferase family protein [Vibrio sp. TH_r3]